MKTRLGLAFLCALPLLSSAQQRVVAHPMPTRGQAASHKPEGSASQHTQQMDFMELVRRFEVNGREIWQKPDEVIELLGKLKNKTVLDLGAGTGYFSIRLARHGARVIAADVDPRFLDYIRQRVPAEGVDSGEVITRLVPHDDPKLAPGEVHAVLMVDVYHHIEHRPTYFARLRKGMQPGSPLLIVDYHPAKPGNDSPPPNLLVSPRQVEAELRKAGFKQFEWKEDWLDYQYVLIAR